MRHHAVACVHHAAVRCDVVPHLYMLPQLVLHSTHTACSCASVCMCGVSVRVKSAAQYWGEIAKLVLM